MNELGPKILGTIDTSDAAPALRQILLAVDSTTILAITDNKGVIIHVNDRFCEISKFSREELVGKTHQLVKSNHHPKSFFIEMWRTIASGKTWNGEIKNKAKDGSHYWVETSIVPLLDESGKPYRFAAIRKDITDKKRLAEQIELERARSLSSEKMAALGEMAAGIAHEVGNPLGAMRGRVEMLKMQADAGSTSPESVAKAADQLLGIIDRTSKIIKGLKSYARDASSDPMQELDVTQLINETLEFCHSRIRKADVKLIKNIPETQLRAFCREAEVGQVLVNLVNNSCDAMMGQEKRELTIRLAENDKRICIEIEDTGPGIPDEVARKIFDPFYTTKSVGSGTGLGLSISRKIMESHGGTLTLKSTGPTCFEVCWPAR